MGVDRSRELRTLAQRVAGALESEEVVLTGSVSRGVADRWSDVELLVPVEVLPPLGEAERAARDAGVAVTTSFGSEEIAYVAGTCSDTMVELVWTEPGTLDRLVRSAFAGELVDHSRLRGLEALEHGLSLRGGAVLSRWQEQLATYPEPLRERLILDAIGDWGGYPVSAYIRQAHRDDRYALVRVLLEVSEDVLRLLFALNRRWEPSWKRLRELLAGLELVPTDAAERIETALGEPEPRRALLTIFELARDAVALVGPEVDTTTARAWLGAAVAALR